MKNEARISPNCDTIQEIPPNEKGPKGNGTPSPTLAIWADPDYRLSRSDLRLIASAANRDWDVSIEVREVLSKKVQDIFKNPRNEREKNAALACVLAFEGSNFRADHGGDQHLPGLGSISRFQQYWSKGTRPGRRIHKSK